METLRYSLEEARRYLDEGALGVAELIAQAAIYQTPHDPRLWSVLAGIARGIGEQERAARYALAAQMLDLGAAPVQTALPGPVPPPPAPDPVRFLLIKA